MQAPWNPGKTGLINNMFTKKGTMEFLQERLLTRPQTCSFLPIPMAEITTAPTLLSKQELR
jgi:hypothetical protein